MFGVSDLAASPHPRVRVPSCMLGLCRSKEWAPAARAAGWIWVGGVGADLRREGERVSAMLSLPVSLSRCASSRNLIYPKIWMLSMWYKWLTFSTWINMEKTAYELGKGRVWRWLWGGEGCTATLALFCPLRQSFGVVNGEIQVLALLHLTAMTWGAATGWWLWRALFSVHSVRHLSVRNQGAHHLVSILILVSFRCSYSPLPDGGKNGNTSHTF